MQYKFKLYLFFILFIVFLSGFVFLNIKTEAANQALETAEIDKAKLEKELIQLEKEIVQKEKELAGQKGQSASLSRDISILTTQINKAKLDIQAKNLTIKKLGGEITEKSKQIQSLNSKIEKEKESLAQLIRKERLLDNKSIFSIMLSQESVSEAYSDLATFSSIKEGIQNSMDEIRGVKTLTEEERKSLEEKKNKETDTKVELENAKKKVELSEAEKQKLLSISKNKEVEYSKVIAERQAEATKIRARLFELAGGVSGGGIPFGDAVKYAEYASSKTGVRTAFILGILKQETGIGKNVGLCYLNDSQTGESRGMNTGKIFKNGMSPTRDVPPFLTITKKLGIDPYNTRVSCPIEGVPGWGGAMGPSQFIPSTWMLFASKIAEKMGVSTANPWNPEHAIMATAIYLQNLGASGGSYTAEINAACKYYSGRSCSDPAVKNAFYGKSVMSHATTIEKEIQFINEN
ncbi:TPA: hypothetical protein DIC38_02955 [Candidatus Nomurabacteria bacterium]|nr:MAG: hypothetical protein O210_OD1C00001G0193 [Parcubacteria bacterium RAAC4_OD1_1]HCY26612.1 hypothetical protein [Candidatus Nomurabacteria bacterium]